MKITAVHVETLELEMEEPFVIASLALAEKTRRMPAEGITVFKIKVGDLPECDEQRVAHRS